MTLEKSIEEVLLRNPSDATRLYSLATYVLDKLSLYNLSNHENYLRRELKVDGLVRPKNWDLAYSYAGKPRLLISLKSLFKNAVGSITNRMDELVGESSNVQQLMPEVVIGYVLLFDVKADSRRREDDLLWSEYCEKILKKLSIRKAPIWNPGLIEANWVIKLDSSKPEGEKLVDYSEPDEEYFFWSLLNELKNREPHIFEP